MYQTKVFTCWVTADDKQNSILEMEAMSKDINDFMSSRNVLTVEWHFKEEESGRGTAAFCAVTWQE